ncbi:MAG: hypothetical protein Q8747_01920 [Candidatus Phytoplasma australasiaticum]|uniref:hypothetical protein n=1 Tax=Candidatus Phytoplasma australasiaticum TaxID=2754999 RepID=UPI002713EDB3|nr:hypothetical protein [Candidatus Phytoplasma australasiaticum]MDO8031716.1 hypothetical protein [Candidatus Phytoplasma australasiaticum]MDO8046585.1 hypothetical protein [Candidatus Phytoplasma australasiaticum]MDO8053298.1 hypothetical protein [Candidatus Phytoplasma australasiaticum]MDO8058300.1 hypothetical protein [Candidatus Phytoplasma australasiaticum]MDO8060714.1 hypothetical protein [Candidatus Phytoplasma australasiaticum]
MQKQDNDILELKNTYYDEISSIIANEDLLTSIDSEYKDNKKLSTNDNSLTLIDSEYEDNEKLSVISDSLMEKDLDYGEKYLNKKSSTNANAKIIKDIPRSKKISPSVFLKTIIASSFGLIRTTFYKIVFAFR